MEGEPIRQHSKAGDVLLCLFLYIPVLWLALLLAPYWGGGLPELLEKLTAALQSPLEITWTERSAPSIFICTQLYMFGLTLYFSTRGRTRDGEEHGSARWGSARAVNKEFSQRKGNKILTKHIRLGLDTHRHRRSLNVLVIGGSGAAKTRSYVLPNILEANTNYVITDPKSEVLLATGGYLKRQGYDIRVLNLVNLAESDGYNPFRYLRDEKDVLKLVTNLIQATTPKGSHESDPFWTKAETALLQAIILMLVEDAPPEEQNFSTVMTVMEYAEVKEEQETVSPLDMLFRDLERRHPKSVAVRQYKVFKQAAGKTAKSILISAAVRLAAFNLPQIRAITDHDDMDLYSLGEKKCALYAVIPDNDTSMNFLVSLLYSQVFQALYYSADQIHHGSLPRHVHWLLDEFAAMPLPGFTRELATMRSRNISASTIIQNMAQIKALYKDDWETIPGNSDTLIYLGGNEASTHEYISKALGKSTIDTKTHGETKGRSGSYSTNSQMSGRELLSPDEVRKLDNRYAILFIRGADPVMDQKYDLMRHPAVKYTSLGGGPPYIHHAKQAALQGTPLFQFIQERTDTFEK